MEIIYAMYWKIPNKYYIGKTNSLKRRTKEHLDLLLSGKHYNIKLQEAFNTFGIPEVLTLEVCESDEVYTKESYWISKYDSVNCGYNLVGGTTKYKKDILEHDEIPIPDEKIICKFILVDENNNFHYITNLAEFCRNTPNLSMAADSAATDLGKVYRGLKKSYKGYRLYKGIDTIPIKQKYIYDIYKDNTLITTTDNIAEFCRNTPELSEEWYANAGCLRDTAAGRRKQHKKYKAIKKAR